MKKSANVKFIYLSAALVTAGICLFCSSSLKKGIGTGLSICADTLIPSLFPFLCLCAFAVQFAGSKAGIFSIGFRALFRLPPCGAPVFLLALLSGYPTGELMCARLLEEEKITPAQARRFSLFCCAPGPAFSVLAVGEGMCGSKQIGLILLASTALAQVLIGLFLALPHRKDDECKVNAFYKEAPSFSTALTAAVESAVSAMLSVVGYVLLFAAVLELIRETALPAPLKEAVFALLEVTNACSLLRTRPPLLAFCLGFGGLSVFFQIKKYLLLTGTSSFAFLLSRLVSGVLSFIICHGLLVVFPQAVPTMAAEHTVHAVSYSTPLSAALVLCFVVFVLDNKKSIKV